MKVAIAHDYLNQYGGSERVLEALLKIFPGAHVYTLLYDKERTLGKFDQNIMQTSFLDRGLVRKNHLPFIPFMPTAIQWMSIKKDYDFVISATAGYAKGISIRHKHPEVRNPFHLAYCYTPLRYAWEMDNYFENTLFKAVFRPAFAYLKNWDYKVAQQPDKIVAISKFIAQKIKKYYNRDAEVVYPPVNQNLFYLGRKERSGQKYFLAAGRLLNYKKFDLVIDAFIELGLPLKIVGVGREEARLKARASGWWTKRNIEFLPFVSDEELRRLYQGAEALIFPQVEDFGLVAAEALSCGTPVIAYAGGGALELLEDGVNGVIFQKQTKTDLAAAVNRFRKMKFNRKKINQSTQHLSFENFRRGILAHIPPEILAR